MVDQKKMAIYGVTGLAALYFGPGLYRKYVSPTKLTVPQAQGGYNSRSSGATTNYSQGTNQNSNPPVTGIKN